MPRPREFDVNAALDRATEVFWHRGYEATSLHDLLGAMGISKSSFYDSFGSKRACYLRALERFGTWPMPVRKLAEEGAGLDAIDALLDEVCGGLVASGGRHPGCFYGRSAVEDAPGDPDVAERVRGGFHLVEGHLRRALERAREDGRLAPETDLDGLSRLLLIVFYGAQVVAKADPRKAPLDAARRELRRLLA